MKAERDEVKFDEGGEKGEERSRLARSWQMSFSGTIDKKNLKRGLWTPYGERADHRKLLFGNPGPGNEMTYRGKLSGRKEAE